MTSNEYAEKLKDPRWQKKRLEIFNRDSWMCQWCGTEENTLVVHHRGYLPDTEPWEYPNDLLTTLCQDCHEQHMPIPRFEDAKGKYDLSIVCKSCSSMFTKTPANQGWIACPVCGQKELATRKIYYTSKGG